MALQVSWRKTAVQSIEAYQVLCHEIKRGFSQAAHESQMRQRLCPAELV